MKTVIFQSTRESYQILGMENKTPNGTVGDWSACWNNFEKLGGLEKIKPFQIETPLLGAFCQSEPGFYNYLIGAVVSNINEAPEGMFLADFPASDFMVFTHEWVNTNEEASKQIGNIVGLAHAKDRKIPDGYEVFGSPMIFIESYNYAGENKRFEVWLPIKKYKQ